MSSVCPKASCLGCLGIVLLSFLHAQAPDVEQEVRWLQLESRTLVVGERCGEMG